MQLVIGESISAMQCAKRNSRLHSVVVASGEGKDAQQIRCRPDNVVVRRAWFQTVNDDGMDPPGRAAGSKDTTSGRDVSSHTSITPQPY